MSGEITPASRTKALEEAAQSLSVHLKKSSGILTANQRLGVAICARDALNCNGCNTALRDGLCPLTLYGFCEDIKHETTCPGTGDKKIELTLTAIVHSLVCFQSKINDRWYKDCIKAILSCGILSNYAKDLECQDEKELQVAAHAVLCEIVIIAAWSHGIRNTFLALDAVDTMPNLPTFEDMKSAPKPVFINFSSLLKRVRQDDSIALAPYFNKGDINSKSQEYADIGQDVWKEMKFGPLPYICFSFVPKDLVPFSRWLGISYLTAGEMLLSWGDLDKTRHCAAVTRHDVETIASAVAGQKNCDF